MSLLKLQADGTKFAVLPPRSKQFMHLAVRRNVMPTQFSPKSVIITNTANKTAPKGDTKTENLADFRFQLTNRLQSSLDLPDVLSHFFQMIQTMVSSSGLDYRYPKKDIRISLGSNRAHSACYNLKMTQHFLGEITFYRDKRFLEQELTDIEMLIGLLMLPLRNAILYRDALEHSLRDPLTGLGNRAALENALTREFTLAKRANQTLSLLLADLDLFKQVNDCAGHATGDALIKQSALAIQAAVRQTDQVFRFGGEEYVVILGKTGSQDAFPIAERIRCAIAEIRLPSRAGPICPTVSLGISTLRETDNKESLLERADLALYRAKAEGRNTVVNAESIETRDQEPN